MASFAGAVVVVVLYLRDLFLLFSGASSLLLFYLWYSHSDSQDIAPSESILPAASDLGKGADSSAPLRMDDNSTIPAAGQSAPIINISSVEADDATLVPNLSADDGLQISFLMVSISNISVNTKDKDSIQLVSNFDRLKAQSTKTLEALMLNRRKMADRSAVQVRKMRVKRAQAAVDSKTCLFRI